MARPVEQAEAALLAAEEDVLGHRAVGHQVDLLVDRADAGRLRLLRRGELDGLAVEQDLAGILPVIAGQDLDQGRLAGAVLADQRMNLARLDLERGRAQRRDAGEALVDAVHGEKRRHGRSGYLFAAERERRCPPSARRRLAAFSTRRR